MSAGARWSVENLRGDASYRPHNLTCVVLAVGVLFDTAGPVLSLGQVSRLVGLADSTVRRYLRMVGVTVDRRGYLLFPKS